MTAQMHQKQNFSFPNEKQLKVLLQFGIKFLESRRQMRWMWLYVVHAHSLCMRVCSNCKAEKEVGNRAWRGFLLPSSSNTVSLAAVLACGINLALISWADGGSRPDRNSSHHDLPSSSVLRIKMGEAQRSNKRRGHTFHFCRCWHIGGKLQSDIPGGRECSGRSSCKALARENLSNI